MKLSEIKNIDLTPKSKTYNAGTKKNSEQAKEKARVRRIRHLITHHELVYSSEFGVLATLSNGCYQRGMPQGTRYQGIDVTTATPEQVEESWVIHFI